MINEDDFRTAMRRWTAGVAIATSMAEGSAHGMTVNSFTSVSVQPPMVTVTLAKQTRTLLRVLQSGTLGITILSNTQKLVAERFAGRDVEQQSRFSGIETFTLETGVPFISGGLAFFECKVVHQYDMPSSVLLVLTVLAIQLGLNQAGLIYGDRKYGMVKFL
jgi:flavin reductase (DIM6/NTAB) family NADH-FMN oxidoreductase RutF